MKLALTLASLFALAIVALIAHAVSMIVGWQDEADEIAAKAAEENDGI